MNKKMSLLSILFLTQLIYSSCQISKYDFQVFEGPYLGQEPPGDEPLPFLPEVFKDVHSSINFSPNGKQVFWKEIGIRKLFFMEELDGMWTPPKSASFSSPFYRQDVPFFSPNGDTLYFISIRPQHWNQLLSDEGIWYVTKKGKRWSSPKNVGEEINNVFMHWQFSVSTSGTIYFAGSEDENHEIWSIYKSRLVNSKYENPVKLDSAINSVTKPAVYSQICPFISPDESYIMYSGLGRKDAFGNRHNLYISYKNKNNTWTESINLSRCFNLKGSLLCPIVSPSEEYLFFTNESTLMWVNAKFIEELRPKEWKERWF
jgi:hypothetical protein